MTTVAYFDCFSGISGDMALGALLDAGADLEALRATLGRLGVAGWSLAAQRGMRGPLSGMRALVDAPETSHHRHLAEVRAIITAAALPPQVTQQSLAVFEALAHAEGRIHGVAAEQVHFHEVGALDAIIDIVGVVAALEQLGVEQVYASPLPLGSGWTRSAHGRIPVPAPATLALLAAAGAPVTADTTPFELVTPTGAALLATLARFERPAARLSRVGYGLGARELERPNALRVWIGHAADDASADIVLLETNIDDQPAEQLAFALEQALAAGALDAWMTPIQMKKGRSATQLAVLVPAALEHALVELMMRETATLGIRRRSIARHVAGRSIVTVATPYGAVRFKRKYWAGHELLGAPEYEDCAALARQHQVPLRQIYAAVHAIVQGAEGVAAGDGSSALITSRLGSGHQPS